MFAKDAHRTANIVAREIFAFALKAIDTIHLPMNVFMKMMIALQMDLLMVHHMDLPMVHQITPILMDTIDVGPMKFPFLEEDVIVIIKMDLPD